MFCIELLQGNLENIKTPTKPALKNGMWFKNGFRMAKAVLLFQGCLRGSLFPQNVSPVHQLSLYILFSLPSVLFSFL